MDLNDAAIKKILDMYLNGMGCINIAIETKIPLAKVISTIRATVCGGQTPRM